LKKAKAFAPAAISSFFEICDTENGKQIADLARMGAIGGGFGLQKGVSTSVIVEKAEKNNVKVFINLKAAAEAKTTLRVAEALLAKTSRKYTVIVEHKVEVPVGMGFGTSAGGALTAGLALSSALKLPLTYNEIGKIAHIAEIECQTGMGTVSSLAFSGGCVLVVEPGAPGICQIDRIPLTSDYVIVAGFLKSKVLNKWILSSPEKKRQINHYGRETLDAIYAEPTLKNFLDCCWGFAEKACLSTENTRRLVKSAKKAGAVGAAQNMIGEAVHALVNKENADRVAEAFKLVLPHENVLVSNIDFQGARLVSHERI
jgi:pantoate kinase